LGKDNIIYGFQPVVEAIKSGKVIDKLFVQKNLHPHKDQIVRQLSKLHEIPVQYVPKEKLNRLTYQNHQGLVAFVSAIEYTDIEVLLPGIFERGKIPFILVLDSVTDVRNFGAIARTAECAGVDAILIASKGAAQVNEVAVKTSAGALNRIPVCRNHNLKDAVTFLKQSGLKVFAATEKANTLYYMEDYKMPLAIIMGSEERGVSGEYLKLCDETVKIPLKGEIESLNVSVATGIVLFEVVKQRGE
jgi:23S rRNA (guanosine2251-2'-O)-methyltransferase